MKPRTWWIASALVLWVNPCGAGTPLTLDISPAQSFAPANVWIRLHVERNVANRSVEVTADSGTFYRSSLTQLDGDQAPQTLTLEWRDLPSGTYQVRALVLDDASRPRATASREIVVRPGPER